jgi:glutathione S-transferase
VYRLYHREGAGRPRRARWAFEEAGAAYEWIVMDEQTGRGEEHARRHPLGRVPVLESDDGLLFESAAICLHVADLNPDSGLIAAPGSHERGRIYQWSFFAMTELEQALLASYRAHHAAEPDAEAVGKADRRLARAAHVVADALDGREFLVGDGFTIADVVMGGVLHNAREYGLLPDLPVLHAYLARLDGREAKQRAYAT